MTKNAGTSAGVRFAAAALTLAVAAVLVQQAVTVMSADRTGVGPLALRNLDESGVSHPTTAVLLNFRAYDTLLEIAVLVIALLGVRASALPRPFETAPAGRMLKSFSHFLVPVLIVAGGYVLWVGSHAPGGAFQAGALLGAAGVVLALAGALPELRAPGTGPVVGLAVFLVLGLQPLFAGDALLYYRGEWAKTVILLIEAGATVSIGWILAGLFMAVHRGDI